MNVQKPDLNGKVEKFSLGTLIKMFFFLNPKDGEIKNFMVECIHL